jgi:adenine-specific DNA-methyltransferase
MESNISNYNVKNLGQVSTPDSIVDFMLDAAGYKGESILNKHILDNSCGDGAFLKNIISRYIKVAQEKNFSSAEIKKGLETYIHGVEIDTTAYKNCVKNLNSIFPANYDIKLGDALSIKDYDKKMDFVVGNPPYVKIHNLNGEYKRLISQKQLKGMVNLYLLFYLLSFQKLNSTGKLIYITPSFFKSVSSKILREKIYQEKKLVRIYNFKHQQIFPNITTYPVISLFANSQNSRKFNYSVVELINGEQEKVNLISTTELDWKEVVIENRFVFEQQLFPESKKIFAKKQKNYCEVKNAFATLADDIFIADKFPFSSSDIIKVVKSSTGEIKECIFPYRYDRETKRYILKDFTELEPNTQNYLLKFQSQLKVRSILEKDKWWQFGRTQAINDVGKNKIYLNSLFNKEFSNIKLGLVPAEMGIYGGVYILPNGTEPKEIENHIRSEKFKEFVKVFGEHRNGNYYLINSRVLTKYLNYSLSLPATAKNSENNLNL